MQLKKIIILFLFSFFSQITFANPAQDEWRDYIDGSTSKPIYYLLTQTFYIQSPDLNCRAVEFGSGSGNEVMQLLSKKDCYVLGIDLSPRSGEVISERAKVFPNHFTFQQASFENAKLSGNYQYAISYFALPFGNKSDLPNILNNISSHQQAGSIFSANFFGNEHTFVKQKMAYGLSEEEIKELLMSNHYKINYFLHRFYKQKDFDKHDTQWDIYDVIAVKQ